MTQPEAEKWNAIYRTQTQDFVSQILTEFQHLLPTQGTALDLASGRGANALFLAGHGLKTYAWDISSVAIEKLQAAARKLGLEINTEIRDVIASPPEPDSFDLIIVSRFLERGLMPHIIKALHQGGLLFYQTFTKVRTQDCGPKNPNYRLGQNELLALCQDLHLIVYREEGTLGDPTAGFRNQAMLIGQRL